MSYICINSSENKILDNSFIPRIVLEQGSTILEWNIPQENIHQIDCFYIQRKIGYSEWEIIGRYLVDKNLIIYRFTDGYFTDPNLFQKNIYINYRLKIKKADDSIEFSPEVNFDLWWKKYLQLIENENLPETYSCEVYYIVQVIVKEVINRKFKNIFKKFNINELYIIEETSHEILLRLLEQKYKPSEIYPSFRSFIYSCGKNWILRYLSREIAFSNFYSENELVSERSPEEIYITGEEKKLIARAFCKLLKEHVNELWRTRPIYSLVIKFWIKRKKDIAENICEVFRTASADVPVEFDYSFDENYSNDEIPLYEMILNDILEFRENISSFNSKIKKIKSGIKDDFLSTLNQVDDNSKSINRIKQWFHRGIAVIRVKMLQDLKDF